MSGAPEGTVGIAGLGLIGTAVAGRLTAAGFTLIGYDVDPAKRAAFAERGAVATDLADLWRRSGRVVVAVFDTAQVAEVLAAAGAAGPRTAVVMTTCDPDRIADIGAAATAAGTAVVEAPISGSSGQLAGGTATILAAGAPDAVAAQADLFAAIAGRTIEVGRLGDGNRTKLAINLVLGLNRAALAEGLVLAERLGLDPAAFLEAAKGSAAYSQVMDIKGGMMVEGRFAPQGRIVQSAKDFALIAATGGDRLPFAALYGTLMAEAIAAGDGDLDNAAVIRAIRRRVGGEDGTEARGGGSD
ncbi:NAD(P)-dependent oxidoreductase [Methylobrevis albus]|uniref:NAD(P)-dependent oxidoreductase n=1 Tax=Methylobrevis albus TaxID=2793297 RepID=A0A931I2U4_9HYPH|nr:NAD(P)-dependent oxidoreductase [Methylobrevis albus]MBH0238812.1 NAD(P)-dependent oxidoreductase [Methylobrevis albus]